MFASDGFKDLSPVQSKSKLQNARGSQALQMQTQSSLKGGGLPRPQQQNFFAADASEISEGLSPYPQSEFQEPDFVNKQQPESDSPPDSPKGIAELMALELPNRAQEEDLRPPDKLEETPFNDFWAVIYHQENPTESSVTESEPSSHYSGLDPRIERPVDLELIHELKLKNGLQELAVEHHIEQSRNLQDLVEEDSQEPVDQSDQSVGEWNKGLFIDYDLTRSLVRTKTGGTTWYPPLSFNRWTFKSRFRQSAIWLNEWIWFERIILGFILVNGVMLGLYDYKYFPKQGVEKPKVNAIIDQADGIFTLVYAFEMAVKLVALGIIEGEGCYFRIGWNVLDGSVVITGFLYYFKIFRNIQMTRMFRVLRPMRTMKFMPAMKVLVPTMTGCLKALAAFWLLLFFYMFIFSMFGLQLFQGITHFRCRITPSPVNGDWIARADLTDPCGGFYQCPKDTYCGSLLDPTMRSQLYALSDEDLYRDDLIPQFNYGITQFDNIGSSLITIFQCLTLEGQYELMNQAINGYNYYAGFLFYLVQWLILFQFLLNLSIAIMVNTTNMNDKPQMDSNTNKMLELRDEFDKVQKIVNVTSLKSKSGQREIFVILSWVINGLLQHQPGLEPLDKRYDMKFFRELWALCEQPIFKVFYLILLVANLLLLNKFGGPSTENGGLGQFAIQLTIIIIVNFLFLLEIVIKLIAYPFKEFASDSTHFLDIAVTGVFFLTYITDCYTNKEFIFIDSHKLSLTQSLIGFNTLRGVRLFNTYLSLDATKKIVNIMVMTLGSVWNYLIPVTVFIYVFALLGQEIFAGWLNYDANGKPVGKFDDMSQVVGLTHPRANFDTLIDAVISVFQVWVGDQWQPIFYDCVRCAGYRRALIYFFFLLSMGNILLMRFTVAFVLWSFQKTTLDQTIAEKRVQLTKIVAPSIMDQPEKLTCPVLQDHQQYDHSESAQSKKSEHQSQSEIDADFGNSGVNSFVEDGAKAPKHKRQDGKKNQNAVKSFGQESNLDNFDNESKSVKFDFNNTLGPIEFGNQKSIKNQSRNTVLPLNSQLSKSHTLQLSGQNVMNTFEKSRSFVTFDDKQQQDQNNYDEENREPFEYDENVSISKSKADLDQGDSGLKKLNNISRALDASKSSKSMVDSKLVNKQLLDNITVSYVKPLPQKKVIVIPDDEKEEEVLDKFKPQKKFDWREHMRLSSLFIFHRDSNLRKKIDRIAFGTDEIRFFKTAQELVDFYKRRPKSLEEIIAEAKRAEEDDRYAMAEPSLTSFEAIQLQFQEEGQGEAPLNKPAVVKEIFRIRKNVLFNIQDLQEQATLIDQVIQDRNKKRTIGQMLLKSRERFFIDDNHQIKMWSTPWTKPTGNQILNIFVQTSIVLSVSTLMFEDPLRAGITTFSMAITFVDLFCQIVFLIEASFKIIALGFANNSLDDRTKIPYIKNMWNSLEFLVLVVSFIFLAESNYASFMGQQSQTEVLGVMRALRMIRFLKPLCQMKELKKLKIACFCLVASLPQMAVQILMVATFIMIFSISGQAFFADQFYQCVINGDTQIARSDPRINTKDDCIRLGYDWQNPNINFDSISTSMMSLFDLLLSNGFVESFRNGIDSRGVDLQPKVNSKLYLIVYFVIIMIVSKLLLVNMFQAILTNSQNVVRDKIDGFGEIYIIQRRWVNVQRLMIQFGPKVFYPTPETGLSGLCARLVKNKNFKNGMMGLNCLNMLSLSARYYGMPKTLSQYLNLTAYGFLAVYNIEVVIKYLGYGTKYFTKVWNQFDLGIVLISNICVGLEFGFKFQGFLNASLVFRCMRLVQLFKLLKKYQEFRLIYRTMYKVLIQFFFVIVLQFFVIYIFAIVGMGFYSKVIIQDTYTNVGNFRSFFNAVILLICCLSGKTWKDVMYELTIQGEYKGVQCNNNITDEDLVAGNINGCGSSSAYLFFIIYILTTRMQFLNLFVSFVIDIYLQCCTDETEKIGLDDCKKFIKAWQDYDPEASCWIEPQDIPYLVYDLEGKLGRKQEYLDRIKDALKEAVDISQKSKDKEKDKPRIQYKPFKQMLMPKHFSNELIDELKLPVYQTSYGDRCHFKDVYIALAKGAMTEEFNGHMNIIIKPWEDTYVILARPKTTFDESTRLSGLMNQSNEKGAQNDEQEQQFNQGDRQETERALLSQPHPQTSNMIFTNGMAKKSSLRKTNKVQPITFQPETQQSLRVKQTSFSNPPSDPTTRNK